MMNESDSIIDTIVDYNKEINSLYSDQHIKKEEGNALAKEGQYKEAEEIYSNAIEAIKTFKPNTTNDEKDSNEYKEKLMKVLQLTKELYSNLSLVQGKRFHYGDALGNALYIIQYIDEYHDKSYIRIINWLISVNQIDKANEVANEVELKFQGEKLRQFDTVLSVLRIKNNEIKDKEIKKHKGIKRKGIMYCGIPFLALSCVLIAYKAIKKIIGNN